MKEQAYIDSERMQEAFNRQMDVYKSIDIRDDLIDGISTFIPRKFPDRDGEVVIRRRSRNHIQHLISISDY